MGAIAAHLFFGNIDIGPFSTRIYLLALLTVMLAADRLVLHKRLFRTRLARDLAIIYLAFIVWTFITRTAQDVPIGLSASHILSNHVFALTSFIVIQNRLANGKQIAIFAGFALFSAAVSALFGVAQWFGLDAAWDAALALRPGEESIVLGTRHGRYGFIPGLALFSISFSYHLITLGLFAYGFTIHRQRMKTWLLVVGIALTGLIFLAVFLSQTRSAAVAIVIVLALSFWFALRLKGREGNMSRLAVRSYFALVLILGMGLLAALPLLERFYIPNVEARSGGYELTRVLNLDDPKRTQVAVSSLSLAFSEGSNLAMGIAGSEYIEFLSDRLSPNERIISSHNLFLNALVLGGIPGVGIILLLLFGLFRLSRSVMRAIQLEPSLAWVGMGAIYGLIAYLINAQFHNSGFVSGDPMPWWIIGVMVALVAYARERQKVSPLQQDATAVETTPSSVTTAQ